MISVNHQAFEHKFTTLAKETSLTFHNSDVLRQCAEDVAKYKTINDFSNLITPISDTGYVFNQSEGKGIYFYNEGVFYFLEKGKILRHSNFSLLFENGKGIEISRQSTSLKVSKGASDKGSVLALSKVPVSSDIIKSLSISIDMEMKKLKNRKVSGSAIDSLDIVSALIGCKEALNKEAISSIKNKEDITSIIKKFSPSYGNGNRYPAGGGGGVMSDDDDDEKVMTK